MRFRFPFRRDNRRPDGFWDAPDANDDNVKGSSVDPYDPVWPRWTQTPPPDGEGEFVSSEPFFDIDEISQKAMLYPAGTPLVDKNVDGNPASRTRAGDNPAGNLWRRRLLVGREDRSSTPGGKTGVPAAPQAHLSASEGSGAGDYYEAPSEVGPGGVVDDDGTLFFAIGRKVFQLKGGTQEERSTVETSVRRVVSSPWTQADEAGRKALANLMNRPGVQTLDLSGRDKNRTLPPGNYNYVNPRRLPVYRTLLGGRVAPLDRVVSHELMGHTGAGHSDYSTTTATDVENDIMRSFGDRADRGRY